MKNINKRKILIIVIVSLLFFAIGLLIFNLFKNKKVNYPEKPLNQESIINSENRKIDLKNIKDDISGIYNIYAVTNKVSIKEIESMINSLGIEAPLTIEKEAEYYFWGSTDSSYFEYNLLHNSLNFKTKTGISWDEVELTNNSFSAFVKRYLGYEWKYKITHKEKYTNGGYVYYAKRILDKTDTLETTSQYNETDFLVFKDGKILFGQILLTNFNNLEIQAPLLSLEDLNKYINLKEYPKTIYSNPWEIGTALGLEDVYLNEEILDIQENLEDCKANMYEVVYLYKSFEQELLTPVYKTSLMCSVTYKEKTVTVSAIAYVNAIDPQYVYIPE